MKKGICWSTLPPEMGVAERFVLAAKAGFQAIEPSVELEGSGGLIRYDSSEADLKQALKMARDNGLTYCSLMGGGVHQRTYPIVDDDAAVRQKGLDSVRRLLEIAATLETGALLFVPHWVGDKVRYDRCYERTLETMRKLAPEAERLGVTLAIENVWNKFLLSPIEFARIIDEVGSPAVQAYFDVGNVLVWGYPHHWIEILGKRICRVHVKTSERISTTPMASPSFSTAALTGLP